jgi:hypothetical protein
MVLMGVLCVLNFCACLREAVMLNWDALASGLVLLWCVKRAWIWWRDRVPGAVIRAQDARRILWTLAPLVALISFWWSRW